MPAPSHSDRLHDNPASPAGEVPSDGIVASPATSPAAAVGSGDSRCLQLEGQASADSGAHAAPVSTTGSSQGHQEAPTLCLQLRGAKVVPAAPVCKASLANCSLSHAAVRLDAHVHRCCISLQELDTGLNQIYEAPGSSDPLGPCSDQTQNPHNSPQKGSAYCLNTCCLLAHLLHTSCSQMTLSKP